jgi:hypothetical protein
MPVTFPHEKIAGYWIPTVMVFHSTFLVKYFGWLYRLLINPILDMIQSECAGCLAVMAIDDQVVSGPALFLQQWSDAACVLAVLG